MAIIKNLLVLFLEFIDAYLWKPDATNGNPEYDNLPKQDIILIFHGKTLFFR